MSGRALTQAEYENISGRAGRLNLEKQFGRAIIVTDSKFQAKTYFETFAQGRLGDVEPPEWDDAFPASDEMGTVYQSNATIHIDGRAARRRHLVLVNKREAWLSERCFEALLEIAVAAKTTDLGWRTYDRLGSPETYHQVIRRLKKDLCTGAAESETLIENNRSKQYRLSVPPLHITFDTEMIVRHFPEGKRHMERLTEAE